MLVVLTIFINALASHDFPACSQVIVGRLPHTEVLQVLLKSTYFHLFLLDFLFILLCLLLKLGLNADNLILHLIKLFLCDTII